MSRKRNIIIKFDLMKAMADGKIDDVNIAMLALNKAFLHQNPTAFPSYVPKTKDSMTYRVSKMEKKAEAGKSNTASYTLVEVETIG